MYNETVSPSRCVGITTRCQLLMRYELTIITHLIRDDMVMFWFAAERYIDIMYYNMQWKYKIKFVHNILVTIYVQKSFKIIAYTVENPDMTFSRVIDEYANRCIRNGHSAVVLSPLCKSHKRDVLLLRPSRGNDFFFLASLR